MVGPQTRKRRCPLERLVLAGFLFAHGWIHAAIYALPPDEKKPPPFDPKHSWALSAAHVAEHPAKTLALTFAWVTTALFGVAAAALLADSPTWLPIAAAGASAGLLLKALFFNPWLSVGVLIDAAVLWAASAGWPESLA